ncbi:hypothetical protein AYK21_03705 [Thermoplasmatales archaeon SG8-52-2]|nr:MAG: hypothetical protein AYK21_03705 [Thermoplasmatales archaeon SG8-52-2]
MTESEKLAQLLNYERKISARYKSFFKYFLIITLLLVLLLIISAVGIIFLGLGTNWFLFNFEGWIVGESIIIGLFVILEILFFLHILLIRRKMSKLGKPKTEYIDGKKIIDITFPKGTDGGVYSKTYIEIDNSNILRLKNLMIPPDEIL